MRYGIIALMAPMDILPGTFGAICNIRQLSYRADVRRRPGHARDELSQKGGEHDNKGSEASTLVADMVAQCGATIYEPRSRGTAYSTVHDSHLAEIKVGLSSSHWGKASRRYAACAFLLCWGNGASWLVEAVYIVSGRSRDDCRFWS